MADFILLMHNDAVEPETDAMWEAHFASLRAADAFEGGSSIGEGQALRRTGTPGTVSTHLFGFIRIRADSLDDAKALVIDNPAYVCGGTVEIRALPVD